MNLSVNTFKERIKQSTGILIIVVIALLLTWIVYGIFNHKQKSYYALKPEAFQIRKDKKYGLINDKGKIIVAPKYEFTGNMYAGMAAVKIDGKWGYVNSKGQVIIKPEFDDAGIFSNGLAAVRKNGLYGYINKKGKFVIKPQFEFAGSFNEDRAFVEKDGKYGFINKKGKIVIETQSAHSLSFFYMMNTSGNGTNIVNDFQNGVAILFMADGSTAYINKEGKYIWKEK